MSQVSPEVLKALDQAITIKKQAQGYAQLNNAAQAKEKYIEAASILVKVRKQFGAQDSKVGQQLDPIIEELIKAGEKVALAGKYGYNTAATPLPLATPPASQPSIGNLNANPEGEALLNRAIAAYDKKELTTAEELFQSVLDKNKTSRFLPPQKLQTVQMLLDEIGKKRVEDFEKMMGGSLGIGGGLGEFGGGTTKSSPSATPKISQSSDLPTPNRIVFNPSPRSSSPGANTCVNSLSGPAPAITSLEELLSGAIAEEKAAGISPAKQVRQTFPAHGTSPNVRRQINPSDSDDETLKQKIQARYGIDGKLLPERAPKNIPPRGAQTMPLNNFQNTNVPASSSSNSNPLTSAEIEILKRGCYVHDKYFPPWDDNSDTKFDTSTVSSLSGEAQKWTDPDGDLKVPSDWVTGRHLKGYSRSPNDFSFYDHEEKRALPNGVLFPPNSRDSSGAADIKQKMVGDCSFLTSLAGIMHVEFRTKNSRGPLLSGGNTVFRVGNGKYAVKLFLNGCWRRILVDDRFPIDAANNTLCSCTRNRTLWVSILEKAFCKIHGGYDFPGSVSSSDVYELLGWVPEEYYIKHDDPSYVWNIILKAFKHGDCIMSAGSSGKLTEEEQKKLGLVDGHSYAILEAGEFEGNKLLLLRNPWGNLRWKGKFGPTDYVSWTDSLKQKLGYGDLTNPNNDTGFFWIDFDSLYKYFAHISMNWNEKLFQYKETIHGTLTFPTDDKDEREGIWECAQYNLSFDKPLVDENCWLVFSQHQNAFASEADSLKHVISVAPVDAPFSRRFYMGDSGTETIVA